ncbi:butyrophilin subfamily 3 member A3-like [Acanthopagrus schlegelii]
MQQQNEFQYSFRPLSVLFFHLLISHSCSGQPQLIAPSQPIVATVGDDIILPCHLKPEADVVAMTLEWTRSDLKPIFVHVRRASQDLLRSKHPSFTGRTSVSIDELKHGNVSLKLSKVKPSDAGRYQCYIPKLNTGSVVELIVGAASSLIISLSEIIRNKGAVVLQCESTGWYPEPEVFWLDGEGNLLSAGPTETVRGPDDLYTVSSRVTVEKRHSNSFTCRVQQNHTNQTREAQIHVPDDFFEVQSSSSSTTVGLAVSLAVCILVILILGFVVWKFKTKRSSKRQKTQVDGDTKKHKEVQQLMTHETVQMKDLYKGRGERKTANSKWLLVTKKRFKEEQQKLKEELQKKNREFAKQQTEVQQLQEQIQKMESGLQTLMKDLDSDTLENLKKHVLSVSGKSSSSLFERVQSDPVQSSSSLSKWPEMLRQKFQEKLQKKITELQEEQNRRDKAEKVFLKKDLQYKTDQRESKKQDSSSLSQNSTRRLKVVVMIDPHGRYFQLRNTSTQEQQLGGWDLKIQVNNNKPIIRTFPDSVNLKADQHFTVGCCGYDRSYPCADLVLKDLQPWSHRDNLQVSLISYNGEIQYNLDLFYER